MPFDAGGEFTGEGGGASGSAGPPGPTGPAGLGFGNVVAKTANYQVVSGDNGTELTFNGSNLTATLPASAPAEPWMVTLIDLNATALTISPNGLQLNGGAGNITIAQNQSVFIWSNGTNYFYGTGPPGAAGAVSSVSAADSSVVVTPTTGAVTVSRAAVSGDVTIAAGATTATNGKINGVAVSGTAAANQVPIASSSSAAAWAQLTAAQVTNAADKSSASTQTFTAAVTALGLTAGTSGVTSPYVVASGVGAGVTISTAYVGGVTGTVPAPSGPNTGWFVIDTSGSVWIYDGTTWQQAANVPVVITAQVGTTYTFALTDQQTVVEGSNASAQSFTVPPNSTVAFRVGTVINLIQTGAGKLSVVAGAGVTINSPGALLGCRVQYSAISLLKTATNTWQLMGDLG